MVTFNAPEMNTYFGKRFEGVVRDEFVPVLFPSYHVGKWWHKGNEVDIVALNEQKKHLVFFECKWMDLTYRQSEKLLETLQEKTVLVPWQNNERKEQYGLVARRIDQKERLRGNGFLAYDLRDWKKTLTSPG